MAQLRLPLTIAIAVLVGWAVGEFVTPLLGVSSFWLSLVVSVGITTAVLVGLEMLVDGLGASGEKIELGELEGLYRVKEDEIERAAAVLADAFHDDPLYQGLFGNGEVALRKFRLTSLMMTRYCFRYGAVYASSKDLEGVMLISWSPNTTMTVGRMIRSGAFIAILRVGLGSLGRIITALSPLDGYRDRLMSGRSFVYLNMIGVAREHQGKGHGGKLLRALLSGADELGLPLYLETETEKNVSIYERFEFGTLKKVTLPVIDQPMWLMVREAGE